MDKIKSFCKDCIGKNCGICTKNCILLKNLETYPKDFFENILKTNEINKDVIFSCNMCGLCKKVCPKNLDISDLFMDLRNDMVKNNNNKIVIKEHSGVNIHQKIAFSKVFDINYKDKSKKIGFMPGCSLSAYSPLVVSRTFDYLKTIYPNIVGISKCCGSPTMLMGLENSFGERISDLEKYLLENNIDEIIVGCQSCYNVIGENLKNIKIQSLYNVLAYNKNVGQIYDVEEVFRGKTFSIFDSCQARNERDIQQSIRIIANDLGLDILELKYNKENARCCGYGGMASVVNKELLDENVNDRMSYINSDYIITYCATCVSSLQRKNKNTIHILDLLFKNKSELIESAKHKEISSIKGLQNRLKIKKYFS